MKPGLMLYWYSIVKRKKDEDESSEEIRQNVQAETIKGVHKESKDKEVRENRNE